MNIELLKKDFLDFTGKIEDNLFKYKYSAKDKELSVCRIPFNRKIKIPGKVNMPTPVYTFSIKPILEEDQLSQIRFSTEINHPVDGFKGIVSYYMEREYFTHIDRMTRLEEHITDHVKFFVDELKDKIVSTDTGRVNVYDAFIIFLDAYVNEILLKGRGCDEDESN